MNCEQVFFILTRGPFPAGEATDADVEHHLEICLSCAGLAEALRPAEGISHEALTAGESDGLPGYRGRYQRQAESSWSVSVDTVIEQAGRHSELIQSPPPRPFSRRFSRRGFIRSVGRKQEMMLQLIVAVFLGACLALIIHAIIISLPKPASDHVEPPTTAAGADGGTMAASASKPASPMLSDVISEKNLPIRCPISEHSGAEINSGQCCLDCHSDTGQQLLNGGNSQSPLAKTMTRACMNCHP